MSIGKVPPNVDESTIHLDASNAVTVAAGGVGPTQLGTGAVTFAKLNASALPKQGAVSGSNFTVTAATFANVTGAEVITNGPSIIIVGAQVIAAASVSGGNLRLNASAGNIFGVWLQEVETDTIADITSFGARFNAPTASPQGPVITTAATYTVIFVGWADSAATIDLQAQSDGTRVLTVNIGSFIASQI